AEDGIRVFHVTGVQTCALPILRLRRPRGPRLGWLRDQHRDVRRRVLRARAARGGARPGAPGARPARVRRVAGPPGRWPGDGARRSEERRVGKGWRTAVDVRAEV